MDPISPDTLLSDLGWLRRLSRSLARDPALAEDICQETLIAAEHQGTSVERSWLARVARNLAASLLRREIRRSKHEDRARQERTRDAIHRQSQSQPDRLLAEAELQRAAVDALMSLGEPYRRTLLLRYMKGLSVRGTSRAMGVPVETVRTRQKRGLEMLRGILERATGDSREGRGALALILPLAVPGWPNPSTTTLWGLLLMKTKVGVACVVLLVLTALFGVAAFGSGEAADPTRSEPSGILSDTQAPTRRDSTIQDTAPGERQTLPETGSTPEAAARPTTGTLVIAAMWKPDRSPASGISVAVRRYKASHLEVIPGLATARHMPRIVVTGSDGKAVLELPPGRHTVKADRAFEALAVEVQAGKETHHSFQLPKGLEVHGRVVDELDRPVAGAEILSFWEPLVPRWVHLLTRSDDSGRFLLRGMHSYMSVGARTPKQGTSDFLLLYTRKPDENDVVTVTIRMPRSAVTLTGVVLDPDGNPLPDAWVKVRMPRGQRVGGWITPPVENLTTNAEGHFEITTLRPSKKTLKVFAAGYGMHRQEIQCDRFRPTHVTVRMRRGSSLRGRVLDKSGYPIADADVQLPALEFPSQTRTETDQQGRFEFADLPAGSLDICIQKLEIGRSNVRADLPSGDTLVRDFVLDAGIVLEGKLEDERGAALVGWWVRPWLSGKGVRKGLTGRAAKTDEQGRFRIPNCIEHPYDLVVFKRYSHDSLPLTILRDVDPKASAGTIKILDDWLPSALIRGRVLAASGAPLKRARVELQQQGYWYSTLAPRTDSDGRFETMELPPGQYALRVYDKGHLPYRTKAVVTKNQVLVLGPVMLTAKDSKRK